MVLAVGLGLGVRDEMHVKVLAPGRAVRTHETSRTVN
jgi:hypothetical protein